MPSVKDLSGIRQGSLLVIRRMGSREDGQSLWECRCDCGKTCVKSSGNLRQGTKSCGAACGVSRSNRARSRHGLSRSKENRAWMAAKQRCHNPKHPQFSNYGARGISMCDEWRQSFDAFIEYIGRAPSPKHTLDRIDNDGDYEPGNVRWATPSTQINNRRVTCVVDLDGRKLSMKDACEEFGLPYTTVSARWRRGIRGWALVSPKK